MKNNFDFQVAMELYNNSEQKIRVFQNVLFAVESWIIVEINSCLVREK